MKNIEIINRPPIGEKKGTIVFLHGACHAAWCWERFMDFFPRYGYESVAFSLPGHGGSWIGGDVKSIRFADYLDATIAALRPYNGDVVLVGHSLGGAIAQKVLADNPGIAKAGVLMATGVATWLPGAFAEVFAAMRKKAFRQVAGMMSRGIPKNAEAIRDSGFFGGRISIEEARRIQTLLRVEPPNASPVKLKVDWQAAKIPMCVVASDIDCCSTLAHQAKIAACYNTEPIVLNGVCHDMMLDPEWERAAQVILNFLAAGSSGAEVQNG